MKHLLASSAILLFSLLLAACGSTALHTSIDEQNKNPLTASRYGDELADTMANIVINNDPILQQAGVRAVIDAEIARGKETSNRARETQARGMKGALIPIKEEIDGFVLYVDDTLFLSSDFDTKPGPELHAYLTTGVDPRDVPFPEKMSIDLGMIQNIFGAQQYSVPHQDKRELYRTFVLYDKKLGRLYGFAQLSK